MSYCDFFFFKQKTAYEMRISDWSSDVCSSDLLIALNIDIAPTILHMAGLQTPRRMQGRDLISAVRHSGFRRKDFFYEHTFMGSPGIPKVEGVVSRKVKYMKFIEHGYE